MGVTVYPGPSWLSVTGVVKLVPFVWMNCVSMSFSNSVLARNSINQVNLLDTVIYIEGQHVSAVFSQKPGNTGR